MNKLNEKNKKLVEGIQNLLKEDDHFIIDLPIFDETDKSYSCSVSKKNFYIDTTYHINTDSKYKNFKENQYFLVLNSDLLYIKNEVLKRKEAKK